MDASKPTVLNADQLPNSKWTAVQPRHREKHFIVTRVVAPDRPDLAVEFVEIEAVYSRRSQVLRWKDLRNPLAWRRGWV